MVKDGEAWRDTVHGLQRVEHDLATEQQQQKEIIPSHLSCHVSHVKTLLYRALPTRETLRI